MTKAQKAWQNVREAVVLRDYHEWDDVELQFEDEALPDYFEKFDDVQDDYGTFMAGDVAECAHEVAWSEAILAKLAKDKTARGEILRDAKAFGDSLEGMQDRHITVIYNPVGGGGKAKRLVAHMVVPVLQLTKLRFTITPTKYRAHAVEMVSSLNIDNTDGIIVCGGDGLVHEVITGYFLHPDQEKIHAKCPVGITPCGTANAMAQALHTHKVRTQISVVGRATLAVAKGQDRKVDVIKCIQQPIDVGKASLVNPPKKLTKKEKKANKKKAQEEKETSGKKQVAPADAPADGDAAAQKDSAAAVDTAGAEGGGEAAGEAAGEATDAVAELPAAKGEPIEIYALSCFGWGMSGAVALKADKLRWIPGQRSARYDIAGFVSLISDWPVADKGNLEYKDSATGEWIKTEISLINMICTNLDYLGVKHPIYPDVKPDDGRIVLSYIDSKNSRAKVVRRNAYTHTPSHALERRCMGGARAELGLTRAHTHAY